MWQRRYTPLLLIALTVVQFLSVFVSLPAGAVTASTSTVLKPERGADKEYYYYDGEDIYGVGGRYVEPVKFIKKHGDTIYIPDGDTIKIDKIKEDADQCESDAVPTKLWDKDDDRSGKEPALYLNILPQGVVELDLTLDKEDGVFRWGKVTGRDNVAESKKDKVPESIDKGTMAKDLTKIDIRGDTDVHLQNSDFACAYWYYKYFHRLVAPYNDDTLEPGPLAGKILGRHGVPFDEYVKKADNRLRYRAYSQSARERTLDHCNRQVDAYKCISEVNNVFKKCYNQSIGTPNANLDEDVRNVLSATWEKEFNPDKFIECFEQSSELTQDQKNYFKDANELKDFAQSIIDGAALPPSLRPAEPDEIGRIEASDETQCSLGMLGWILCPTFSFIAAINDQVFNILKNWLILAPFQQDTGGSNAAAYSVWSKLRNIVNALFIIFFIVLIYSQVTGKGVSTYGMRALFPRIIIGALLVNLSYVICSLAVDISNSLGDSIYRLMSGMRISGAAVEGLGGWENVTASIILGGGAAVGALVLIANLSALVPVMVMAFVALISTFLLLLFRQALVIIFVAASPLAFALFVLPGTVSWFNKWRSTFVQLLMLYPAFALIFAGAQIAAEIVRDTAAVNGDTLLTIFSLGIQVIPLFLLPLVMKLGGGVLNRFGGIINNPHKGPLNRMKKRADEFRKDRKTQQQARALNGKKGVLGYGTFVRMNQRSKAKRQYHASNAKKAAGSYAAQNQADVIRSALGSRAGKDMTDQLKDILGENIDKELRQEYKAALVSIENDELSLTSEDLMNMATGAGQADINPGQQAAAMDKVIQNGDIGDIDQMLDAVHAEQNGLTELQREVIMKSTSHVSGSAAHLSASNIEQTLAQGVAPGQTLSQALYANAAAHGTYTPETLASQDADAIKGLAGSITGAQLESVRQNFAGAKSDAKLNNRMTDATRRAGDRYL